MTALKQDIVESLRPLPYAREMQAWLIDFLAAATNKKKPPADYIRNLERPSATFVDASDINEAVDFIKAIYAHHGYLTPWELESELIKTYNPELPQAALKISADFSASELVRDPLTGYYQKPQVPLVMGLSALYAESQSQPVSVFEIDFSNMRGTNEHNEKILRCAYPEMSEPDIRDRAMQMTDQYAYLVSNRILSSLREHVKVDQDVSFIPLRTGGDELRVVAVDMKQEQAEDILAALHDGIEAVTATLGLHDHPHAKRPTDDLSNGFGAAGSVFMLEADGQFDEKIAAADKEIAKLKIEIGRDRVDKQTFAALRPENFDLKTLYSDQKAAQHHLAEQDALISQMTSELSLHNVPVENLPTLEDLIHKHRPQHIPDKTEVQGMFFESFREIVGHQNIILTADQEKVLRIKVLKFPQEDPSSGALIGRDFPAMAGAALQVVHDINEGTGQSEKLWTMGLSFHNLSGLNETLGHGHSNLALRYQAQDIIKASLHKTGLSDQNFQMAHMGNGDFYLAIQPVIVEKDGSHRTFGNKDMQALMIDIESRLDKLNDMPIKTFLQRYGATAPDNVPERFRDMENPRDPKCPGLRVSISAHPYATDPTIDTHNNRQGGAITRFISEHLNDTATQNKQKWAELAIRPDPATKPIQFGSPS